MIVVDASAWVTALLDAGARGDAARAALTGDPDWAMPDHARLEVVRTLSRAERAGVVGAELAAAHVQAVMRAEARCFATDPWLLEAVWRLRHRVSPYDAPYVVLARALDTVLLTCDQRLAAAASSAGATVELVGVQ